MCSRGPVRGRRRHAVVDKLAECDWFYIELHQVKT